MNIFQHTDYINVLKEFLSHNKGQMGIKTELANASGCKLSYLSHVLSGDAHFTMDHAYGASQFMKLKQAEQNFFLLLVQNARSSSREYKNYLCDRIKQLKSENFKVEKIIKSDQTLSQTDYETYASNWLYQAVHIYLTIPQFQRFEKLREKLSIPSEYLREILNDLSRMNLVIFEKQNECWRPILKNMHAPITSPITIHRHMQWKMCAIQNMQRKKSESVHYSSTFSLSKSDFDKIKYALLEFIRSSREQALSSPEEIVSHVDISFFEV